jgi:hypothetical protein
MLQEDKKAGGLLWRPYEVLVNATAGLGGRLEELCANVYLDGEGKGVCVCWGPGLGVGRCMSYVCITQRPPPLQCTGLVAWYLGLHCQHCSRAGCPCDSSCYTRPPT